MDISAFACRARHSIYIGNAQTSLIKAIFEINFAPQDDILGTTPPAVVVIVTLFRNKISADRMSYNEITLEQDGLSIQCDRYPYKEKEDEVEAVARGRTLGDDMGIDEQRSTWGDQKLDKAGRIFLQRLSREHGSAYTFISLVQPPECYNNKFLLLKLPVWSYFVMATLGESHGPKPGHECRFRLSLDDDKRLMVQLQQKESADIKSKAT